MSFSLSLLKTFVRAEWKIRETKSKRSIKPVSDGQ